MKLKVLDLFSGIGGFSLGLERTGGFETVAFCEIERFCQKVLKKHWPDIPIYNDIRVLKGENFKGSIDVICGGYPCQPFSVAGKQRGKGDDRHLWPEYFRLIREIKPRWVIGENVAGHINLGIDSVLSDLESEGYTCELFVLPACAVGAGHRRDRTWVIGYAEHYGPPTSAKPGSTFKASDNHQKGQDETGKSTGASGRKHNENVADPIGKRLQRRQELEHNNAKERREIPTGSGEYSKPGTWLPESGFCRVANGVPNRVDRLKSLGNSVVPQIIEVLGSAILEIETAIKKT